MNLMTKFDHLEPSWPSFTILTISWTRWDLQKVLTSTAPPSSMWATLLFRRLKNLSQIIENLIRIVQIKQISQLSSQNVLRNKLKDESWQEIKELILTRQQIGQYFTHPSFQSAMTSETDCLKYHKIQFVIPAPKATEFLFKRSKISLKNHF